MTTRYQEIYDRLNQNDRDIVEGIYGFYYGGVVPNEAKARQELHYSEYYKYGSTLNEEEFYRGVRLLTGVRL